MSWITRLRKALQRLIFRTVLLVIGPAVIAVGGFYFYMSTGRFVSTENAYIKTDLIIISAEVAGRITAVPIANNQRVAAGDVLFRIDPERFEIERDRRQAELRAAYQHVASLEARYRTKQSELTAAQLDMIYVANDLKRMRQLLAGGTISETRLLDDERELQQAELKIEVLHEQLAEVLASLGGDPDLPPDRHPDVLRAKAELREAEADLKAATVRAPKDAIAANLTLQLGEYVEDGDPVLSLVSTAGFWVEANLKETQLTHLQVGQEAQFEVDAYPDVVWRAEVASLAPATGAEYALLPPQNASGNWVKVVQRVPVKLRILPQEAAPELRAGMSVRVSIDTKHERPLPEIATAARAWVLSDSR